MQTTTTIAKVFEPVLSIPGMNKNAKIQFFIPREIVLLLSKIIERGLAGKDSFNDDNILDIVPKETLAELNFISDQLLKKAG